MSAREIPRELLAKMEGERKLIEQELPELAARDDRMREAAEEDTLSGHLRRAIHHSRRPLRDIGLARPAFPRPSSAIFWRVSERFAPTCSTASPRPWA